MKQLPSILILLLALLLIPGGARGQLCELPSAVASAIPDTLPAQGWYGTIRDQGVPFDEIDLGIGHLHASEASWEWEWLSKTVLPLSETPGALPWGWIANGWLVDAETAQVVPFGSAGLLETGYEDATFIVLDDEDGWIRIRFAPESAETGPNNGTAWVPACVLTNGAVELEFELWESRLTSDEISPLFFRSEAPMVLRDAPRTDAPSLGMIAGDYHLEPLEIVGDWMRVVFKQPSDYCMGDLEIETKTGWIQWRSAETGPSVWYYTRGC